MVGAPDQNTLKRNAIVAIKRPERWPNEKGRHCWRPLKIFHRVEEKQRSLQRS
jgi:hypothetical protein